MGKRKIVETYKEYKDGQLVNETITETEEDYNENESNGYIHYTVPYNNQAYIVGCSSCGCTMIESPDNSDCTSVSPRILICPNPNCTSFKTHTTCSTE